ncbi:MAG TPA: BON domain-containing protein [Polyangia bacterium]
MPNRDWGRDDDGMRDERWRRDMGRDFSRHEWSPYDRERDLRDREMRERDMRNAEMRNADMRNADMRDREVRGDYRESGFGFGGTDRYFGGGGYGGYGNYGERGYGERGYGGRSMAERAMGDRGAYRTEYYDYGERPMGRAPKGYQRSDERIKEDVCDWLMHSWVDAENVEIEVRSGEVVLAGSVEDRAAKRAIEDIADRVLGVKDVQNNIRVRPRGGEEQQRTTTSQKKPSA